MTVYGGNSQLTEAMIDAGADPRDAGVVTRELRQAEFLSTENRGKNGLAAVETAHGTAYVLAYGAPLSVPEKARRLPSLWHLPLAERVNVTQTDQRLPDGSTRSSEEHERQPVDPADPEHYSAGDYVRLLIEEACIRGRDWLLASVSHVEIWSNCHRIDVVLAGGTRTIFASPGLRLSGPTEVGFETVGRVGASVLAAVADVVLANRREAERLGTTISTEGIRRALGYAPATEPAVPSVPPDASAVDSERAPPPCHRCATPIRNEDRPTVTPPKRYDMASPYNRSDNSVGEGGVKALSRNGVSAGGHSPPSPNRAADHVSHRNDRICA